MNHLWNMTVQFYCAWLITNLRNNFPRLAPLWNNLAILQTWRLFSFFSRLNTWRNKAPGTKPHSGSWMLVSCSTWNQQPLPCAGYQPLLVTQIANQRTLELEKTLKKSCTCPFPVYRWEVEWLYVKYQSSTAKQNKWTLNCQVHVRSCPGLHFCSLNLMTTLWGRLLSPLILRSPFFT